MFHFRNLSRSVFSGFLFCLLFSSFTPAIAAEATAIFAGGCFWCMEKPFDELDGVLETTSGYIGGNTKNPTYKAVSKGITGHIEALAVTYDPAKIDYLALLQVFWVNVDPFDGKGQFCDKGPQYVSAIFVADESERKKATQTKQLLKEKLFPNQVIATKILPASDFYPAENYHQNFYIKSSIQYHYYRYRCGRDNRLQQIWQNKTLPF